MIDTEIAMGHYALFKLTSNQCSFSPNGIFLASAVLNEITIRKCQGNKIHHIFTCSGVIEHLEWSQDSKYILCGVYQLRRVHVFAIQNPEWKCKLTDVESGIIKAFWSPDSRHVLAVTEFNVSITVWSLVTKSVTYIESPSTVANSAYSFIPKKNLFVIIEDHDALDFILFYSTSSWKQQQKITSVSKERLGGISCSPSGDTFFVWDSLLDKVHVQVFETNNGKCVASYKLPDCHSKICGVQDVCWSPSGQFLALGCLDDKVRILNNITWQLLVEFSHNNVIHSAECKVLKEPTIGQESIKDYEEHVHLIESYFEEMNGRPITISSLPSYPNKGHLGIGIGLVAFSSCNRYLVTVVNRMPAVVWVWSMEQLSLHSIAVHSDVVTMVSWNPVEPKLAVATGSSSVSIWSPKGVSRHDVPVADFVHASVTKVKWHPSGESIALCADTELALVKLDCNGS